MLDYIYLENQLVVSTYPLHLLNSTDLFTMSKVDEARAIELNNVMQERSSVNRQLLQAKAQYSHQTTLKRKSELTSSELADLPEDIVVYRAVGTFRTCLMRMIP
jgi:hypothetical protein